MIYDAVIIGAGFGGLSCASLLAKKGKKVLVLEKSPHSGGTSSLFSRKGYLFPMGPLGFSQPQRIMTFLDEIGVSDKPAFERTHYQLLSPDLECIYSVPLEELREELRNIYPKETGIDAFFNELEIIISQVKDIHRWHPDYFLDGEPHKRRSRPDSLFQKNMDSIAAYSAEAGKEMLDRHFTDPRLMNFLGSMGTEPPRMSSLNLALMWYLMAEVGIWFPSTGMQGLIRTIENTFLSLGGELRLGHPVKKILLKGGSAAGVQTAEGDIFRSRWVVSNADTKKTLLEFFDEGEIPSAHISKVLSLPYTDSELCVYAGVDPGKVNWKALKARHLFYRHKLDTGTPPGLTDFENREIAITMWSDNMEGLAPPAKKSLVLRIGFPYSHFSDFWTGEKKRRAEYVEYKNRLSESVVRVVENILPGLRASIEFMEAATPLTYQDWGNRYRGSIAGWSWDAKSTHALGNKLLIRTPIPNLLMAGIYAASELFLGGIPTAVHTGCLAAEHICKKKGQPPD